MSAPEIIRQLVERFTENITAYHAGRYNEAQLRREFLDPMFEALGWDVSNRQGYAEQYKEVIYEPSIEIDGERKAPDYCFRIGKERKFFVEAKKPSVNIRAGISSAYQLRRYAWSAKLPLSILTDFEEFAIYETRTRPDKNDKASTGRVRLFNYRDYLEHWHEIADVFSRDAIPRGQFDKYVETNTTKRGTQEVDDAFLLDIENWRDQLARNFALRNPAFFTPTANRSARICQNDLNFAVQHTIDRLVFLRICEDRAIEPYGQVRLAAESKEIYLNLVQLFQQADQRYNSGLFHFNPKEKDRSAQADSFSLSLHLDDRPLKEIISRMYFPDSPYEFSVIPADILGQVYERFLGKVIRLTTNGQAKVEEKPEVRKAGGVYYTPTYIVDYIVKQTVGKLLEGKTLIPSRSGGEKRPVLRILDMSCGSGSFLIVAYQVLLDWYLAQYMADDPERWLKKSSSPIFQDGQGQWRLTTEERKHILLDHVFGVDIDSQAVEVTKLSLLLKVLEGEDLKAGWYQLSLLKERALPDLDHNIQCGNSLIGPDFYDGQLGLDDDNRARVNVFDWHSAFPEVFAQGGFDAIVGNPPYIRIQTLKEWAPLEVEFYKRHYVTASKGNYDIYVVFVEKGLELLNQQGRLGYILPHKFFNAQYGEQLRNLISKENHLSHIVHFGDQQVFEGATTYTCLLFLNKEKVNEFGYIKVNNLEQWKTIKKGLLEENLSSLTVSQSAWNFSVGDTAQVFSKLKKIALCLGDISHIFVGTQTSADDVFVLSNFFKEGDYVVGTSDALGKEVKVEAGIVVPFLKGRDIRRFETPIATSCVICPYEITNESSRLFTIKEISSRYPFALHYLDLNKQKLQSREKGRFKGNNWYAFGYPKSMILFQYPKIIVPDYNNIASFTYDTFKNFYKTGYGILLSDHSFSPLYVLGLLNSSLLFNYLLSIGTSLRGGYVRFWTQFIKQLPIHPINFSDPTDVAHHDRMVVLVEQMLKLHKDLVAALTPDLKTSLQRQIDATDTQIDHLVYDLYGLTDEEIRVVEGKI